MPWMPGAAVVALLFLALPQEPPPPEAKELVSAFLALPAEQRSVVLGNLERRIQTSPDELVQRISGRRKGKGAYGSPTPVAGHDPKVYAPVAPTRTLVASGTADWQRARTRFPVRTLLPDLTAEVVYDWASGKPAWLGETSAEDLRFANLVHGWMPGSDHAVAQVLAALDTDPRQRLLAEWFHHAYAELNGRTYQDITLYEAWYSGEQVDVPDVDAIAFARKVLKTQSFVSPIPDGRRRDRLYQQVRDAAVEHRQYRTLREVAAATFVSAKPPVDPTYTPLIGRCHYLWARTGYDVDAFAKVLAEAGDRSTLLEGIDQALREDPAATDLRTRAQEQMVALAVWLRQLAAYELARARGDK
ncbi:MAG: hypothetical protein RL148_1212 [Planctomycetota bacterium]|jgi:hypothetical protein